MLGFSAPRVPGFLAEPLAVFGSCPLLVLPASMHVSDARHALLASSGQGVLFGVCASPPNPALQTWWAKAGRCCRKCVL